MGRETGSYVGWLRPPLLLWFAILLIAPAFGQDDAEQPKMSDFYSFEHFVHVVPRNPSDYHRITAEGRLGWFVRGTVGPKSLTGGVFSAAIGTAANRPYEYGTHWNGYADRFGMRLTGISTGNAIEATLGAAWSEDPRYFHTVHDAFGDRVKNVLDLTFRAYHADGERHLAYARFVAIFGNNFLSNTWRVPSEADWQHAMIRSAEGFSGRMLSNAVSEFLPQVWRKVRNKPDPFPAYEHNP